MTQNINSTYLIKFSEPQVGFLTSSNMTD